MRARTGRPAKGPAGGARHEWGPNSGKAAGILLENGVVGKTPDPARTEAAPSGAPSALPGGAEARAWRPADECVALRAGVNLPPNPHPPPPFISNPCRSARSPGNVSNLPPTQRRGGIGAAWQRRAPARGRRGKGVGKACSDGAEAACSGAVAARSWRGRGVGAAQARRGRGVGATLGRRAAAAWRTSCSGV